MALAGGVLLNLASAGAGFAGPWLSGLDPETHSYPAIIWVLVGWTVAHSLVGVIMQLYALARSLAGRTTPTHDADVRNITLYHHFLAVTAATTNCVIGLFPEVA